MSEYNKLIRKMFKRFREHGLRSITRIENVIPKDDESTLFICAGMQSLKSKFKEQTKEHLATIQTCIRTDDLSLIGDGTHLTSFRMLGNFSFGNGDYEDSVEMWDKILRDLKLKDIAVIHVHPDQHWIRSLWLKRHYAVHGDNTCIWSDGDVGGFSSEVYYKGIEVGNLVYPLEHSVDVGFGLERLLQIVSQKSRVDETELFDTRVNPMLRDHYRTLQVFYKNKINPGNKGREYVCRRLVRRCLTEDNKYLPVELLPWFEIELVKRLKCMTAARKHWNKNSSKPFEWWWDTFGITFDEYSELIKINGIKMNEEVLKE
jgi:alanyl-tRNA synthetase